MWKPSLFKLSITPPWRRQWQPTPVLLPGKSHGRRSLVGCSTWGCKELDKTERLHFHFSLPCIGEGNGNPLQCSCLENPRDSGVWLAAIYGVSQSRTRLKQLSNSSSSITLPAAPGGSDIGPEAFVIPTGCQGKQHCALRRPRAGREAGRKGHVSSLCTQLPSQTTPESLILALSALALSLLAKIFFLHLKKVLCSSLTGCFTKTQQGQGEHNSEIMELWKYIRDRNLDGRVSSLCREFWVNMLFPFPFQNPKVGGVVASSSLAALWSFWWLLIPRCLCSFLLELASHSLFIPA